MDPSRDEGLDCCAETLQQVKGQNPSLQHLQRCQVPTEHGDGWETAGETRPGENLSLRASCWLP